ncbi:hypothetical protein D3C80_1556520 [compost metagenome]
MFSAVADILERTCTGKLQSTGRIICFCGLPFGVDQRSCKSHCQRCQCSAHCFIELARLLCRVVVICIHRRFRRMAQPMREHVFGHALSSQLTGPRMAHPCRSDNHGLAGADAGWRFRSRRSPKALQVIVAIRGVIFPREYIDNSYFS